MWWQRTEAFLLIYSYFFPTSLGFFLAPPPPSHSRFSRSHLLVALLLGSALQSGLAEGARAVVVAGSRACCYCDLQSTCAVHIGDGAAIGICDHGVQVAGVGDGAAVPVLACHVMTCHLMSSPVIPCPYPCHVRCAALYRVTPYCVMSYRVLPWMSPRFTHSHTPFFTDDSHSSVFHPHLTISTSHVGLSGPIIIIHYHLFAISFVV